MKVTQRATERRICEGNTESERDGGVKVRQTQSDGVVKVRQSQSDGVVKVTQRARETDL